MEPRGHVWFALQRVVQDFRDFSGLEPKQAPLRARCGAAEPPGRRGGVEAV
jgi:hypothetical protein